MLPLFTTPRVYSPFCRCGSANPVTPWLPGCSPVIIEIQAGAVTGEHHRGAWTDVGTPERLAELDATPPAARNVSC